MTDKYTYSDLFNNMVETHLLMFDPKDPALRFGVDINQAIQLMNQAYEEGKKDEHSNLMDCNFYPSCAHFSPASSAKICAEVIGVNRDLERENEHLKEKIAYNERLLDHYNGIAELRLGACEKLMEENERLKEKVGIIEGLIW